MNLSQHRGTLIARSPDITRQADTRRREFVHDPHQSMATPTLDSEGVELRIPGHPTPEFFHQEGYAGCKCLAQVKAATGRRSRSVKNEGDFATLLSVLHSPLSVSAADGWYILWRKTGIGEQLLAPFSMEELGEDVSSAESRSLLNLLEPRIWPSPGQNSGGLGAHPFSHNSVAVGFERKLLERCPPPRSLCRYHRRLRSGWVGKLLTGNRKEDSGEFGGTQVPAK